MSIDYDAVFGIGYEVEVYEELPEDYTLEEYVEENLTENFNCEVISSYSCEEDRVFIMLNAPFADGLDLTDKKVLLDTELERLNLDFVGTFGAVGGLDVS